MLPPTDAPHGSLWGLMANKRKAIVTLRWLLIIAAAYTMLFAGKGTSFIADGVVICLLLCNLVIARLPDAIVNHPFFEVGLLLVDTTLLSIGFYLTRALSSDFYILYFFVIFLAGVSERLTLVLIGALLVCAAYVSIMWVEHANHSLSLDDLVLRLLFILAVALFYGFLVERVRQDREQGRAQYVEQLEKVNAQLRELVELKEAFLGAVSHELRTPLNAMVGYIDLIREGTAGPVRGRVRAYVDRVHQQALHLSRMIEELLSFENLARGRVAERAVETDMNELTAVLNEHCEPEANAKGLKLQFIISPEVVRVVIDSHKLLQVLFHLINNAIKFTDRGEVHVSIDRYHATLASGWEGFVLECAVSDTGPGIPTDQQEIIFEEFRQLDGSPTRRFGGMGLGLSVCRGLVQLMRGDILLESVPGHGSTFRVRVPAEDIDASSGAVRPRHVRTVSSNR